MCGIFGWFGSPPTEPEALFATLSRLLQHRGPDDQGFECGPGWGLGFRRLSILDLSELGHQPMRSPDGRYWLVFNGEIYNYLELRATLEQKGVIFRGTSDTEVLLNLLACEGASGLQGLNGMFALTLIDTVDRTFLLARDRLGQKPLYYHTRPGHLRFASELKSLLAWPDAPRQLDPQAVAEYLVLSYLSNETCIFKDYLKLPPGHYLTGSLDKPEQATPQAYWCLELNPDAGEEGMSRGDLETLADLLTDAVQIRLRSDVPVGVFLSGGIDSGLVAVLAAKSQAKAKPLALTVGFPDTGSDETSLAQITANHAGLESRIIPQRVGGLSDIDRLAWFYDEPFGDVSALPTMTLCEVAAKHATVFLSGDGGDEAFGGYRRYIEARHYTWLDRLPRLAHLSAHRLSRYLPADSSLRYRLVKSSLPDMGFAAIFDGQGLVDPALKMILSADLQELTAAGSAPVWKRWTASQGADILTRQQALDYALYLPDDILVKVDRASMAHSIEVRSPFLDYRLVEWAARLPRLAFLNSQTGKLPLRELGKIFLPNAVQQEVKRGFGVPLGNWFRRPAGSCFARERLLSSEARERNLWDVEGVAHLFTLHQAGRGRNFGLLIWRLLMLDAWARHYLDGASFLQGAPAWKED